MALISGKGITIENQAGRVEMSRAGYGATVEGLNIAPTKPKLWGDKKFNAAIESVSINENYRKNF